MKTIFKALSCSWDAELKHKSTAQKMPLYSIWSVAPLGKEIMSIFIIFSLFCRQTVPGGVYQRCQKRPFNRPATPVRPQLGLPVLNYCPAMTPSSSPSPLLLNQSLKSMHDGSRLSYHLKFFCCCVQGWRRNFKEDKRSHHCHLLSFLYLGGKKWRDMDTFKWWVDKRCPVMFLNISLSLWNIRFPGGLWQSFFFFSQGGDCSVSPPTLMYIMYILYVYVYHKMKYICLHVWCTLSGIERQYYVA